MEIFKKSIILLPASFDGKSDAKGILTLEQDKNKTKGLLKCFNIQNLSGSILLGISSIDNELHKFKLEKEQVAYFTFSIPQKLNLSENISCVLVQLDKKESSPIIWGSTTTNKVQSLEILEKVKAEYNKNNQINKLNVEEEYLDEEVENLIDNEVNNLEEELRQKTLVEEKEDAKLKDQMEDYKPYKELFETSRPASMLSPDKFVKELIEEEAMENEMNEQMEEDLQREATFYDEVKDQIDALFEKYERETALEEIIPNSKFVRVDFNNDGRSYIFGVINDSNNQPEYIVYGIPSRFQDVPPEELEGYYQWLPLDVEAPEEDGYYMMYQDARTGEHVKIEIV